MEIADMEVNKSVQPAAAEALLPAIQEKFFTLLDKESLRLPTLSPVRALPGEERAPSPIVLPTEERIVAFQRAELARKEEEARRRAELDALASARQKAEAEQREQELARQAAEARAELERVARLKEAKEAREQAENQHVAKIAADKAAKEKAERERVAKLEAETKAASEARAKAAAEAKAEAVAKAKAEADKARTQRAKPVTPGTSVTPAKPVARAAAVGEGGLGSGGGGGGDRGAGDLDWYDRNVLYPALYRNWIQPRGPDFAGKKFQVQVRISVKADGTIIEKRLVSGSGDAVVDESVQDALSGFTQAGPLPQSFTGSSHSQSFTFVLD